LIEPQRDPVQVRLREAREICSLRYPSGSGPGEIVAAGGLMSYGADLGEVAHQVGLYTGNILKGAKPADLPVQQSTKFSFAINLQTARALGIEVPSGVLSIADEVIE
jgi:putative ABC transport system substrate-binding protein